MDILIDDLLSLAKSDEGQKNIYFSNVDLSGIVIRTVREFEASIFELGKSLELNVCDNIHTFGDGEKIKQMISLLMDNAVKYTEYNGIIRVSLSHNRKKAVLHVENTGPGIPKEEWVKIFDRFYRVDTSRSRNTGGSGLGLSVAKSIVELHKGKINILGTPGENVIFEVEFSLFSH